MATDRPVKDTPSSPSAAASTASRAHAFAGRKRRRSLAGWLLLGALGAGTVAVAVIYRLRPRQAELPAVVPQPLPAGARQGVAGFSYTSNERGHPVFTVRAERSVDFTNGEGTTLEGVEVEMFGRAGDQHNLLRTRSCQYNSTSGNFSCAGAVQIELDAPRGASRPEGIATAAASVRGRQPVYLETQGISYDQEKSLVSSPARVRWHYGPASGEAVGLEYSTGDSSLELERDVTASLPVRAPATAGAPSYETMQLAAARLRYSKGLGQIDLAGPVRVTEGTREITSDRARIRLDSRNRLLSARLEGSVSAEDRSPAKPLSASAAALECSFDPLTGDLKWLEASGGVRARSGRGAGRGPAELAADHARVNFVGAHFHPSGGTAAGNVHLLVRTAAQPAGAAAPPVPAAAAAGGPQPAPLKGEELDASELQFTFRPEDAALDHAHTVGPGKMVLEPAGSTQGRRVITAGQILMSFDSLGRLASLHGTAPTRIVFEPRPGAPAATPVPESRADRLEAQLDPARAALERAVQSGHFELLDGERRAQAAQAEYSAGTQAMNLTGTPVLTDPDTRINADRVEVHLDTNTAEGFGHVASTHFGPWEEGNSVPPTGAAASSAAGAQRKDAASKATTSVLADHVIANRTLEYLRYEGHVRAWQGADVLEAPSVDVYRHERRMAADEGVVTSDLAPAPSKPRAEAGGGGRAPAGPGPASQTTGGATEPLVIRADRLEYFDLGRQAAYRGHVRMDASGATLNADRLDAYFTAGVPRAASQLDHAVADGHVIVVEPGRRASSDHAEYFAADGKVVLTGGPPTLYDAAKGFTTGRSLTFFTHDDTLLVDGGLGTRALSKRHLTP